MIRKQFPFLDDTEQILGDSPRMNLYDEEDLISNIKGDDYQDRSYEAVEFTMEARNSFGPSALVKRLQSKKSYVELAREEARENLKKKRSISYLTRDFPRTPNAPQIVSENFACSNLSLHAPLSREQVGEIKRYGNKLRQNEYILAIMESNDGSGKMASVHISEPKNSYDFLKTSQVYNRNSRIIASKK